MTFYQNGEPRVIKNPDFGIVVDFGVRKVIASPLAFEAFTTKTAEFSIVAFLCYNAGDNIIFLRDNNALPLRQDGLTIVRGMAVTLSDSLRIKKVQMGSLVSVKFGTLEYWSDEVFVPYELQSFQEAIDLGMKVNEKLTSLPSLHRNKVSATLQSIVSHKLLGIEEGLWSLAALHLLLYRPVEDLYNNFKKDLESFDVRTNDDAELATAGETATAGTDGQLPQA